MRETQRFVKTMRRLGLPKMLQAELTVSAGYEQNRMFGSGLLVVNPPWTLPGELAIMLPAISGVLRRDAGGGCNVNWLTHEK